MTAEASMPVVPSRRGWWIVVGTVSFMFGYPIFLTLAFKSHPTLTAVSVVFGVLGWFMYMGFGWARVLCVFASGGVALFFLFGTLRLVGIGVNLLEPWQITLLIPLLPMIGYTVCAAILCLPAVGTWQQAIRENRTQRMIAREAEAQSELLANADVELEPCPWCEAVAVDPIEGFCRSCNRPA